MKVKILDLNAQYKSIKSEIDFAIKNIINETSFIGGRHVDELEKNLASYCGTKYAVALNSGTDALYLALWAKGIGKGDEVITTPFTFFATAEVISRLGAKPVFVDIDPKTFNIDVGQIEAKITKRTKAILPVHLFGAPAEMSKINSLARKYKLYVVEDACQAIGSIYRGKKSGNLGHVGCFSFFPSKNLGCYGDGGALTTNSMFIASKVRMLRNHGSKVKYYNDEIGVSSRLDGIQAAILNAKIKHLDAWNKERNRVAQTYNRLLQNIEGIELPVLSPGHVFHQYTLRVKNGNRDRLKKQLHEKGIQTMIYYPIPLHLLKAMEYLGYKKGELSESEKACDEVLSLPIYPELKERVILAVVKAISACV